MVWSWKFCSGSRPEKHHQGHERRCFSSQTRVAAWGGQHRFTVTQTSPSIVDINNTCVESCYCDLCRQDKGDALPITISHFTEPLGAALCADLMHFMKATPAPCQRVFQVCLVSLTLSGRNANEDSIFLSCKNFLKRATGMFKHTTQLFYHKSIISRKIWTANLRFTFS